MGCDIHLHIEYHNGRQQHFAGRLNPGRNYRLFGALAGVRCEEIPHIEPRGFPPDAAWETIDDYTLWVRKDGEPETDTSCSAEDAERWGSQWWNGERTRVVHPDWHTPSWLALAEYRAALERPEVTARGQEPEYAAALAAMERLEIFGFQTRVVFWFDN